jgi:hypothetical protein
MTGGEGMTGWQAVYTSKGSFTIILELQPRNILEAFQGSQRLVVRSKRQSQGLLSPLTDLSSEKPPDKNLAVN